MWRIPFTAPVEGDNGMLVTAAVRLRLRIKVKPVRICRSNFIAEHPRGLLPEPGIVGLLSPQPDSNPGVYGLRR